MTASFQGTAGKKLGLKVWKQQAKEQVWFGEPCKAGSKGFTENTSSPWRGRIGRATATRKRPWTRFIGEAEQMAAHTDLHEAFAPVVAPLAGSARDADCAVTR